MKKTLVLTACIAMSGCVTAERVHPLSLTDGYAALIRQGLASNLKDPYSAMGGKTLVGMAPDGTIKVCGMVNAKNSFGGYTGMKPYRGTITGGQFILEAMGGTDYESLYVLEHCEAQGLLL